MTAEAVSSQIADDKRLDSWNSAQTSDCFREPWPCKKPGRSIGQRSTGQTFSHNTTGIFDTLSMMDNFSCNLKC